MDYFKTLFNTNFIIIPFYQFNEYKNLKFVEFIDCLVAY